MANSGPDKPASSVEQNPEAARMDARGEIKLLSLESKLAILETARDKYYPRHWYCADLITRAVNMGKGEAAKKMFACFDKWISNPKDTTISNALFSSLAVDKQTRQQMESMEKTALVHAAMTAGEYRNEHLAALSLYSLLNSPSSTTTTSSDQRYFNDRLLKTADPQTLADLLGVILNVDAAQ